VAAERQVRACSLQVAATCLGARTRGESPATAAKTCKPGLDCSVGVEKSLCVSTTQTTTPARRVPLVGGNWKMNTVRSSACALAEAVSRQCAAAATSGRCETVVFPPICYLDAVGAALREHGSGGVQLGAQDAYFEPDGAFTGEISLGMIKDLGATWLLVGHSERRHVLGESDALVNKKLRAALEAGLKVILAIGETLSQREAGETDRVNRSQLVAGLAGVGPEHAAKLAIAYEPVWAIGTGKTATPADAQAAHAAIRAVLSELMGKPGAAPMRIQYGGSMKGSNAAELLAQPEIDGGLIGGASLKPEEFASIVNAAVAS
jgi:triosephosphate isomerase (TIM)